MRRCLGIFIWKVGVGSCAQMALILVAAINGMLDCYCLHASGGGQKTPDTLRLSMFYMHWTGLALEVSNTHSARWKRSASSQICLLIYRELHSQFAGQFKSSMGCRCRLLEVREKPSACRGNAGDAGLIIIGVRVFLLPAERPLSRDIT